MERELTDGQKGSKTTVHKRETAVENLSKSIQYRLSLSLSFLRTHAFDVYFVQRYFCCQSSHNFGHTTTIYIANMHYPLWHSTYRICYTIIKISQAHSLA